MEKIKYFDYAATTPPCLEALDAYVNISKNVYGNPGSDKEAKLVEEDTRKFILKELKMENDFHLIFTSGGTEANNLAIQGSINERFPRGCHFITTKFEHSSVYENFKELEYQYKVSYADIDKNGYVDIESFKRLLRPETRFVSIMHVNNELGTEQPIESLYKIVKEYNEDIEFMVDAVQGIGKTESLKINPDIITISSHKIYGPKSVGAVILKKDLKLRKILLGGTKEGGSRAGTQSLPAQVGFAKSIEHVMKNKIEILEKLKKIRLYLQEELQKIEHVFINVLSNTSVVSIFLDINLTAKEGVEYLYQKGIVVSTKSADNSDFSVKSRVLKAIKLSDFVADRTYRISLSHRTSIEEIDYLTTQLKKLVESSDRVNFLQVETEDGLKQHLALREEVFIKEQGVEVIDEIDEYDVLNNGIFKHYNMYLGTVIVGTCRVYNKEYEIGIGRVSIKKEYRGRNLGSVLIQKIFQEYDKYEKNYYIESQFYALDFYKKLGFKEYGSLFIDANIKHKKMLKKYDVFE